MQDNRLERAIGLVNSGKTEDGRNELELIIKEDRKNIAAWRWYAETWSKASDKIRVWEACLRYNPANFDAQQALIELNPNQLSKIQKQEKTKLDTDDGNTPRISRLSQSLVWGSLGLIVIIAVAAVVVIRNSVPKNPEEYKHTQPVEYYLYVPKDYSPDQEWPLFVGIHGSGGSGLECWNLWQSHADKEGFILLCPTIPGDASGYYQDVGEKTVWGAINAVKKDYRIKPRMFFSGFSAGAFFIQGFHYHYPQNLSGLAILSSGVYMDPRIFSNYVPVLVVIGDRDNATAVQTSKLFADDLQSLGYDVQYQVMSGMGHTVNQKGINLTIDLFRSTQE